LSLDVGFLEAGSRCLDLEPNRKCFFSFFAGGKVLSLKHKGSAAVCLLFAAGRNKNRVGLNKVVQDVRYSLFLSKG